MKNDFNAKQNQKSKLFFAYLFALTAVIIWGGSFVATQQALGENVSFEMITLMRFLFALPVLIISCSIDGVLRLPTKHETLILAAIGFQGVFFHQIIQAMALRSASADNGMWFLASGPAFVALFGYIFLKEKLSCKGILGIALAILGIAFVQLFGKAGYSFNTDSFTAGDIIMLLSVVNWAAYNIISRKILKDSMNPSFCLFWELVFALIYSFVTSVAVKTDFGAVFSYSLKAWLMLIYLGAGTMSLCYLLWLKALALLPAARLSVFQLFMPVVSMILSNLIATQNYTVYMFPSCLMIALGVILVNSKSNEKIE